MKTRPGISGGARKFGVIPTTAAMYVSGRFPGTPSADMNDSTPPPTPKGEWIWQIYRWKILPAADYLGIPRRHNHQLHRATTGSRHDVFGNCPGRREHGVRRRFPTRRGTWTTKVLYGHHPTPLMGGKQYLYWTAMGFTPSWFRPCRPTALEPLARPVRTTGSALHIGRSMWRRGLGQCRRKRALTPGESDLNARRL